MNMKKTTIAVVDDHQLFRQMWGVLFAGSSEYEVIGEGGAMDESVEMIRIKRPDIVFLDINLSQGSGLEAVPLILKFSPGTKIIAVSMHNDPGYAKKMLSLGAKGYVTKNSSQEEMFRAIKEVMNGKTFVCAEIKNILTDQMLGKGSKEPSVSDLSLREIGIIKLIKEGLSSKEIAAQLNIATRTVEVHRHNILNKLKLKNTASLINFINTRDLNFN
jgi:DNA-binding NarL/FixJ family response regulator